jgi:hypothetical protein
VERAHKEGWTVARARATLGERRSSSRGRAKPVPCFEQGGPGRTRLVVHLDRLRDPSTATDSARDELARILHSVLEELAGAAAAAATAEARPADRATESS